MEDKEYQGIGIEVVPINQLVDDYEANKDSEILTPTDDSFKSGLASHILTEFTVNKDARRSSGVERLIVDSVRSYNGEYSAEDLARIAEEGGSSIFMNITATKSKIAKSWISDIYSPLTNDTVFSVEPSVVPELPRETEDAIRESIDRSFAELTKQAKGEGGEGVDVVKAQELISKINRNKRESIKLIHQEIKLEAKFQVKLIERQIEDQLIEGDWENALGDFIEDFTIYPTAIMKGPVVSKKTKLTWVDGKPTTTTDYVFMNKRVDPLDMYPGPSSTGIQDGNLIEHVRFSRKELADLKDHPKYYKEAIEEVLERSNYDDANIIDTGIEQEKADQELRGTYTDSNRGIVHGLHYFGTVSVKDLREWQVTAKKDPLKDLDDTDEVEVEGIVIGSTVIKCEVNKDPLLRRPYYKASFYNRPGSFWGRSLPEMMKDIQRMCNATARALANNLGISSGPMAEIQTDRLADDGDIEAMYPMKIYQTVSSPSGASGPAVSFFQPRSNAQELLAVYKDFEQRADEVTGVPKYAYGNEKVAGAATTASGLSLILESATKIIRDAVRNIDTGLIKPRIEFQFYYNLVKNPDNIKFTGDVDIVPVASKTLTVKSSQQLRRNEFLQATANKIDQQIMGVEGRAELLRELSKDLGLSSDIVPNVLELRKSQEQAAESAKKAQEEDMKLELAKVETGLKATELQISGQERMHQGTQETKREELTVNTGQREKDREVEIAKAQGKSQLDIVEATNKREVADSAEKGKSNRATQEIALKLKTGKPGI